MNLTHLDKKNRPTMVDVGDKEATSRIATASGVIQMSQEAYDAIVHQTAQKGPVLQTAVVAAVLGAKKTPELIPMCHPLLLTNIATDIQELPLLPGFRLFVTCKLSGKTGVEMEALTGVSVGLLTIYDMIKAIDKSMVISEIQLEKKEGVKVVSINDVTQKVEITYPVAWSYRPVGRDPKAIEACVKRLLGEREYTLTPSNQSRSGKFISFACNLLIMNEDERLFFYEEFKRDEAIVYLL